MSSTARKGRTVFLAVAIVCSAVGSLVAQNEPVSGYGTATIDGMKAPGEWDGAAKYEFEAMLPAEFGGGTTPTALYVMNDSANLYVGVEFQIGSLDEGYVDLYLDKDDDGQWETGDINLMFYARGGLNSYYRVEEPESWTYDREIDGSGSVENNGTYTFYELSHALEATVGGWPIALAPGDQIGLAMMVHVKPEGSDGTWTYAPDSGRLHVIIAAESEGQAEMSEQAARAQETPTEQVSSFGTAVIDGVKESGEWDGASMQTFNVFWPAEFGGGTVPATFHVMNDEAKLYIAVDVGGEMADGGYLGLFLYGDMAGGGSAGDVNLTLYDNGSGGFLNGYIWNTDAGAWNLDSSTSGTGVVIRTATGTFFEISYMMDIVGEEANLSLSAGDIIGCRLSLHIGTKTSGFLYTLHPVEGLVTLQVASPPN
jgi:hypothetical protein